MRRVFKGISASTALVLAVFVVSCDKNPMDPPVAETTAETEAPLFDVTGTPNKQMWKQCQNNHDYEDDCKWVTGNLNQTHNTWAEGDFVPKILRINNINNTDPFVVTMTYGFMKGGLITHDFLGEWDLTQIGANPCVDGSFNVPEFCTSGSLNAIDFTSLPMDGLAQGAVDAVCPAQDQTDMAAAIAEVTAAKLVIKGINVDAVDGIVVNDIVLDGCPVSGDAEMVLTMTVKPTADAVNGAKSDGLLLLMAAHVAREADWTTRGGAGGVSGSPYHLGLVTVDDESAGSMDLQMSAAAIVAAPELVIVKTAESETITAGDDARFTITLTNNGPGTAVGATINDPLPAGLDWSLDSYSPDPAASCAITGSVGSEELDCGPLDLAQGASITATVSATTSPAACGTYDNDAFGDADNHDPVQDDALISCDTPVLSIVKTAESETITAGDDARFTITLTNNGPGTAVGATINDPLPAGLDWSLDSYSPDPAASCAITGSVGSEELDCGPLDLAQGASITATVSATTSPAACGTYDNDAFGDADNAAAVDDDALISCDTPVLSIVKTAESETITAGDDARFTITLTNNGPGTAVGATINDPLPAGLDWSLDSYSPDPAASCAITGSVGSEELDCGPLDLAQGASITATVSATTSLAACGTYDNDAFGDADNAAAVDDDALISCQTPELSIVKTAESETITAGDDARFTITLTNNGPGTAVGATINDPLPAGLDWSLDSYSPDPAASCAITGSVGSEELDCGPLDLAQGASITATVSATTSLAACGTYDNDAFGDADNAAAVDDDALITCQTPVLSIVKTAESETITAGDDARFTITLTNNGPGTAVGATINDPLPAGLDWSLDSYSPDPAASCAITGSVGSEELDCGPLDLAQGASITATVSATTSLAACGTYDNDAFGDADNAAAVDDDALITCQTPVLSIVKTAESETILAGDDARFTITLTNNGPGTAVGATINDPLPAGLDWSLDSYSPDPAASCAITGSVGSEELDCGPLDLAQGASITATVSATTSLAACGTYDNDAFGDADNAAAVDDDALITCEIPPEPGNSINVRLNDITLLSGDDLSGQFDVGNVSSDIVTITEFIVTAEFKTSGGGGWTDVGVSGCTFNPAAPTNIAVGATESYTFSDCTLDSSVGGGTLRVEVQVLIFGAPTKFNFKSRWSEEV